MSADAKVYTTECLVTVLPIDHIDSDTWSLKVQYTGDGRWRVMKLSASLSISGEWEYEPIPSERTEEWLATHRFEYAEAIRLAVEHAPHVRVNGLSATEIRARINADREVGQR